jgi:hypothetical protein
MHKILKFFRFPAQSRSTLSTHAAHLPSGVLSPAEMRRLVADMVD